MLAKSVAVCLVVALSSLVGCGSEVGDEDVDEADEEATTAEVASALSPPDDRPSPHEIPVPKLPSFDKPIWDLQPFFQELDRRSKFGGCFQYYVTILNPTGGEPTEVPVTVCK
ncbi:MAG: hypothetical protein KIS78_19210 [Labilithrix sp.]|nr:hypothetical protein [Labilithrix sp.]MCW5834539.1 hypothetical protein [Labilithrix sp.]